MRIRHNSHFGRIFPLCKTSSGCFSFSPLVTAKNQSSFPFLQHLSCDKNKIKKSKQRFEREEMNFNTLSYISLMFFSCFFQTHSCNKLYTFLDSQVIQFYYFVDPSFPFRSSEGALLSLTHNVLMEKIVVKHEANNFVFSIQRVCLFPPFVVLTAGKAKSKLVGDEAPWM